MSDEDLKSLQAVLPVLKAYQALHFKCDKFEVTLSAAPMWQPIGSDSKPEVQPTDDELLDDPYVGLPNQ